MTGLIVAASELSTLDASAGDLNIVGLSEDELPALDHAPAQRVVALSAISLGARALQSLLRKPLPRLSRLELGYCAPDVAVDLPGSAPLLQAVRTLVLRGPVGGAAGLGRLVKSPLFARLEALELSDSDVGDAGCDVLAAAAAGAQLKSLSFGRPQFGAPGDVSNSGVTAKGCARIVSTPAFASLWALDVALTDIDGELAARLVGSPLARFVHLFPGSWRARRAAPGGAVSFEFRGESTMPAGPPEGPLVGTLTLSDGRTIGGCGAAAVFSGDGSRLAVPIWEKDGKGAWTGRSFARVLTLGGGATADLKPACEGSLALWELDGHTVRGTSGLELAPKAFSASVP